MKAALLPSILLAAAAAASPRESASFASAPSNGVLNSPLNSVRTFGFAGGYALGRVTFSGTLTSQVPATWSSDCRVLVTAPGGQTFTIQPVASGGQFSTVNYSGSFFMPAGTSPQGQWSFRFYETFDDGGAAVDALNTLNVTLTDDPPSPPAAVDLGELSPQGLVVPIVTAPARQVAWYTFTTPAAAESAAGSFVDVNTRVIDSGSLDSRIALFSASGALIAMNDDSGPGLASQLSFGAGGGAPILDGLPRLGQDGPLPAGRYYLAVGADGLTASAGYWNVASSSASQAVFRLEMTAVYCRPDFNGDGFLDFFDYDDYVSCYETGACPPGKTADFNGDGFADFFDYDDFVGAFEAGC